MAQGEERQSAFAFRQGLGASATKQHFRNHAISILLNLNADSVFPVNLLPFTLV
jgi:hypothetical protein